MGSQSLSLELDVPERPWKDYPPRDHRRRDKLPQSDTLCSLCARLDFQPEDAVHRLAKSSRHGIGSAAAISLAASRKALSSERAKKFLSKSIIPESAKSLLAKSPLTKPEYARSVYHHQPSLQHLERSASYGCRFCRLLWNGLRVAGKESNYSAYKDHEPRVALYLTAYRTFNDKSLKWLGEQHIVAVCGPDRFMTLDLFVDSGTPCYLVL